MKGIILAAGQGIRLRPLTDDRPKCMVEYRGIQLIDRIMDTLSECGVSPLVIVAGYRSEVLENHVRPRQARIIVNSDFDSTNMVHSLFCAEDELCDDILISYSDIIYKPEIVRAILDCPADLAITIDTEWRSLWQRRMDDPLSDAETLELDQDGCVLDLGHKPNSYDQIQGQYMGLIKISGRIWDQVKARYHSLDRQQLYDGKCFTQMFMTTFLRELIRSGIACQSVPVQGGWLEIDAPSDLNLPF
jgi:choline kinase